MISTEQPIHLQRFVTPRRGRILILAGVLAFGARADAQERPPQPYTEAIAVEVVNVDVMVVDSDGAAVPGLTREDFELFVDKKRVTITNFSAYFAAEEDKAPRLAEATRPATPRSTPPASTWLIYVDLMRSGRTQRVTAVRGIQRFLENAFRPGDRIMVACYDGNALRVLQPLTSDPRAAIAALRKLESRLPSREFAALELLPNPDAPVRPDLFDEEKERRIRAAIHGLRDLMAIADGIEGRIGLLFVSGGYKLSEVATEETSDFMLRSARLHAAYARVLERLSEGRIAAYTIFAGVDDAAVDAASEISTFADETGGVALTAMPGLDQRLRRVRRDFDSYYSLGFRPPSPVPGGRFNIEVRVRRPDVRVRHRSAVRLRTDEEAAQDATMAALLLDEAPANPWNVQVAVGQVRDAPGRAFRVPIIVAVPLANVVFTAEPKGRHSARLIFNFAIRDAKGNYRQLDSRQLPLDISSQDLERAPGQTIQYGLELLLAPGSNELSVTVSDPVGRGSSSARKTIVVR